MMKPLRLHLRPQRLIGVMALVLALFGCNDRRPFAPPLQLGTQSLPQTVTAVADVLFDNGVTEAFQMSVQGNTLHMSGRPFGYSAWDIGANPESPHLIFAASDNMPAFSDSATFGPWLVTEYASTAMLVRGPAVFLSGNSGASVLDISSITQAREIQRYQPYDPNQGLVRDEAFMYRGWVADPFSTRMFGFREFDFVYTQDIGQGSINLLTRDSYGTQNVCCVRNAAYFRGNVYVAMTSRMWIHGIEEGLLTEPLEWAELEVTNVVANGDYLYVQHEPTVGNASGHAAGIYVFDAAGLLVTHLPITPLRFAVHPSNTHIYANPDNQVVRIYRLIQNQ